MKKEERKLWQPLPTRQERMAYGKGLRIHMPRKAHAAFDISGNKRDPLQLIIDSNKDRIQELVPIRYRRMLQTPFTFYRGSAILMAEDMSRIANTGLYVQSCGDCHLLNFGGYATPERKQVFDINDFDETLPAPFEWDLKRLAASIVLAGRYKGFPEKINKDAAFRAIKMYASKMHKYSGMGQLEIWYSCLDKKAIENQFSEDQETLERFRMAAKKALQRTHEHVFPKLSQLKDGKRRFSDDPPYIYHLPDTDKVIENAQDFFDHYSKSLSDDKKVLLQRFRLLDAAIKVVGVGSVGTRCFIALFMAEDDDVMILQFKEACTSVLENYAGKSIYGNHGERIVNGQKLMQTVSDIFLGWTKDKAGHDFYVRQLRDMKATADVETFTPGIFMNYALLCGWSLAKSHAKSGKSPEISGYIGQSDAFAQAIADFAVRYANQTEKDYQVLSKAAQDKVIEVQKDL